MVDIKRVFHGMTLGVNDAGQFENEEHKIVQFDKNIKLQVGQNFIKVSAIQLAGLLAACRDPEVKAELQVRFEEEKAALDNLGGF